MIRFLSVAILVSLVTSPICRGSLAAEPAVIDGIAAIVNGEVITFSQVRSLTIPRERLLRSQLTGDQLAKELQKVRQEALQDLIDRQLIVQQFHKDQLQLPDFFV